jgi:hypothetical protein
MLKTISAALLAVSVLAAPAFAAPSGHRHDVGHHRHHRHHHKMGALGKHHISKVAIKHAAAVKRG